MSAVAIEEDQLRRRITRATGALREESWTVDDLRSLADLLESVLSARRRIDPVGNVAWLADRRNG